MTKSLEPLTIDIVSDVVCPWCYLGKRRLETAIGDAGEHDATVRWRPYQLDPTIPAGGVDRATYIKRKFGSEERIAPAHANLTRLGADVGIAFAFDKIKRSPNTLDAHRLIRWSLSAGAQNAVVDRLFRLYFEEGRDIGDKNLLVEVAEGCGMDGALVGDLLERGDDAEAVRAEIAEAQALGVGGVPFFIFASRYAVAGAQEPDVLRKAMNQARQAIAGIDGARASD